MIRHRPYGSGHPYSVDTEQRHPVDPVAGEPVTLGVRTSGAVGAVRIEYTVDGGAVTVVPLAPAVRQSRGQTVDGGHLASAQARLARASSGWSVALDSLTRGERYRYRFVSDTERTRWFEFSVSAWEADGDRLVLTDGTSVSRVRVALPLAPGEHVTGFGERYDALDHRGASLDSIVFEQY